MEIEANATRMELLRLKKRLTVARRGHKLLKDKQDELMRKFLELVEVTKKLRLEIDRKISKLYKEYYLAVSDIDLDILKIFFSVKTASLTISSKIIPVMNLRLPQFKFNIEEKEYSPEIKIQFAIIIDKFKKLFPEILELAEKENNLLKLAEEIERTRRRVNALEYVLIPALERTIKFISMKISETERGNTVRLMKVKEIIEAQEK